MSTYTKINKETATYTKVDKGDVGWFRTGWFFNWFMGLYTKVTKEISNYSRVDK